MNFHLNKGGIRQFPWVLGSFNAASWLGRSHSAGRRSFSCLDSGSHSGINSGAWGASRLTNGWWWLSDFSNLYSIFSFSISTGWIKRGKLTCWFFDTSTLHRKGREIKQQQPSRARPGYQVLLRSLHVLCGILVQFLKALWIPSIFLLFIVE